jgi:diguanylate cyclase (GGDEF)-like protein
MGSFVSHLWRQQCRSFYIFSPHVTDNPMKNQKFRSFRNRILVFSILITLFPSFGMGWFWYDLTRKATTDKIEQKLIDCVGIAERAINLWFKERNYDLRVFANSFVVLENLREYRTAVVGEKKKHDKQTAAHLRKITTYLSFIRNEFKDYRRLLVLDNEGRILAASDTADQSRPVTLPANWQNQIASKRSFTGDVYFIEEDLSPLLLIGIPLLLEQDSAQLGFFVMEVRLQGLLPLLKAALPRAEREAGVATITLLRKDGRYILSSVWPENHRETAVASPQVLTLFKKPYRLQDFINDRKGRAVGLAGALDDLPWDFVIAENYDNVFFGLLQARNRIILITIFLTVIIGGAATIVARQFMIPLKALTNGVLRVSGGDLDVTVDIVRNDELGIVARMFNEMVGRLKENQAKLEQLATTDSLTGLANRKQIMAEVALNFEHYRRHGTEFSILMIDIDFFKNVNDGHGHLAGDAVLIQLAGIFRETLRTLDKAGRYGGEEFLVILVKTDINLALQIAERIRLTVEQHAFVYEDVSLHVSISVGAAGIAPEDQEGVGLIGRADRALYEAKASGRNRIAIGPGDASVI